MALIVKDEKGRTLVNIKDKNAVFSRFVDLEDGMKEYLISLYIQTTNGDGEKFRKFLNFEEDEDQFCT